MPLNRRTAVIGTAIRVPVSGDDKSLEERLYEITEEVLADAGLGIGAIDGIVVASNDQFDGRAISVMMASGSVGGVDRDILSTPSASEHAFVMGVLRVASGQYETQLVVSWSPTEASSLAEAQRLGADPYFHRILPLDETSAAALQASVLTAGTSGAAETARRIAERNLGNGRRAHPGVEPQLEAKPPWPIETGMVSSPVTGLVALVLASEDFVRAKGLAKVAWVKGMGWATEPGFLGDRDLTSAPALKAAAQRAYAEAEVAEPGSAFDVIELTGTSPYQELLAARVLGVVLEDGAARSAINPSGGVTTLNPVFCTGMIRIAEAANQVMGKAGAHQAADARVALAHAASGFAMMYQTVLVLGADDMGDRA